MGGLGRGADRWQVAGAGLNSCRRVSAGFLCELYMALQRLNGGSTFPELPRFKVSLLAPAAAFLWPTQESCDGR